MPRAPGAVTFRWPSGTPFDSGALCLDLVYTGGPGDLAHWERLHTPEDLREWVHSGPPGPPPAAPRAGGGPGDLAHWERLHTPEDLREWVHSGPLCLPLASPDEADLAA